MAAPKLDNAKAVIAVKGFRISPIIFKNRGGSVTECLVEPALPFGLTLFSENNTCVIDGAPLHVSPTNIYTVTASNNVGSAIAIIEMTVSEAPIKSQRSAIIAVHDARQDLDTPRSQIENAVGDAAMMGNAIKPHEKFKTQPMGDDNRLSQQTANNPDAENRAQSAPELTPSPSAQLQAQAVNAARPNITPSAKPG